MKPNHLLCAALALSLTAPMAAPAAARAPASSSARGFGAALKKAVSYCETVVTRQAGAGLPFPMGANLHDGAPPAAGVPDIVKRFAATQRSGGFSSSPFYAQFLPAAGGQIWAVVHDGLPTCDLMVTGSDGDMPAAAAALSETLRKDGGWRIVESAPATAAMPLARHLLVKKMPPAGGPGFDVQLSMRALGGASADRDGVQMELSFLGGGTAGEATPR